MSVRSARLGSRKAGNGPRGAPTGIFASLLLGARFRGLAVAFPAGRGMSSIMSRRRQAQGWRNRAMPALAAARGSCRRRGGRRTRINNSQEVVCQQNDLDGLSRIVQVDVAMGMGAFVRADGSSEQIAPGLAF